MNVLIIHNVNLIYSIITKHHKNMNVEQALLTVALFKTELVV